MSRTEKEITLMRRLDVLELQKAGFGAHTPPHVITEIEDLKLEIAKIRNSPLDTKPKKAWLIGRHDGEIPDFEIIERRAINFPATVAETLPIIKKLFADAEIAGVTVIFQNVPGQVAITIAKYFSPYWDGVQHQSVGVVISKLGERQPDRTEIYNFSYVNQYGYNGDSDLAVTAEKLAKEVNPNAKTQRDGTDLRISFSAPMKFEFSHIEWF